MHTVVQLPAFLRQAKQEGMTDEEVAEVVNLIAANPTVGDMIERSGDCRKVRVAGPIWGRRRSVSRGPMEGLMARKNENFDRIMEGLGEAFAFARGEGVPGIRVHIPAEIDIKAIRGKLGQTQAEFAEKHGFSVGAVRDWEQGRAVPDRSTRAFLKVIAAEPKVVERVLETT